MKELSIEEKAKAYDEAIEKLRKYLDGFSDRISPRKDLEVIFPELKESKDERIRKELIEFVKSRGGFKQEYIAWLEKQGEHAKFINGIQVGDKVTRNEDGVLVNLSQLKRVAKKDEKQGEQKPVAPKFREGDEIEPKNKREKSLTITKVTDKEYYSNDLLICKISEQDKWQLVEQKPTEPIIVGQEPLYNYTNMNIVNRDFEPKSAEEAAKEDKVDNQNCVKPTDKVEPKFKNGQWIVWQDKYYKVNYNGCGYELVDQNGLNTSLEYGTIDENAHLWTINDAKDGDVLKEDSCIFIIKRMEPNGTAIVHCCLFDDGDFSLGSTLGFDVDSTYPATKEQRDLLFQKMKEAGYNWDAEKKELKKFSIESTIQSTEIQHKPAEWGDEDERMISGLLTIVEDWYNTQSQEEKDYYGDCDYISWLKSLKDRVQPQPKQEWSEEDEGWLDNAIVSCEQCGNTDTADWLKSLRPQNRWKPSDLPYWKKSTLPNANTTGFNSDYFCHKGYCINYKELFEKLPKDD